MNCWRCFPLFFIGILTTDEWGSHIRYVIEGDSSIFIQHIECMRILIKHLTRRAICFPHAVNFIKKHRYFIEKYMFY
ncbi:transposase [Escherichia coli]|nr:transposase [Escherichia coli]